MTLRICRQIAVIAASALLGACAQGPMHKDAGKVALHCPAGSTLTCEADTIGRLRHGTFAKNMDKCACVQDGSRTIDSPVIPAIQ
jgi:hypothetical protein